MGSVALAVIAVNAGWLVVRVSRGRRLSSWLRSSVVQALVWLIVSLYLLLPPFFAWRHGAISPYLLGLAELDWLQGFGPGALLAALLTALILFGWLVYRHALPEDQTGLPIPRGRLLVALRTPIDAALAQWHLAFYRAAAIAALAEIRQLPQPIPGTLLQDVQAQSLYWGAWLGLLILLVEGALNPFSWSALRSPTPEQIAWGRPEAILRGLALAVCTTAIFVITRNLWLCLACQVIVETAIAGWLPLYRPTHQMPEAG